MGMKYDARLRGESFPEKSDDSRIGVTLAGDPPDETRRTSRME